MLLCLTASHRSASFDLLERLTETGPAAVGTLLEEPSFIGGVIVLATCNRFEVYLDVDEAVGAPEAVCAQRLLDAITALPGISGEDADELRDALTVLRDDEVARHLFAVSAGLESVVVGEDEIVGQVRRALEMARRDHRSSSALERLFQTATRTSRGVKSRTRLGGAGRSLVRLALELAESRLIDWAATRVLLAGTGQYAATTVAALRARGAQQIAVYSASGRALPFATKHRLAAASELRSAIADADLVITCTTRLAIRRDDLPEDGARRLVIDLGLPRNVEADVARAPGVDLLDLETIALHAPLEALTATEDARELVGRAAAEFAASSEAEPAIVALRAHVFGLLEDELARAAKRGDDDGRVAQALRHFASVLLHGPSQRARELAAEGETARFADGIAAVYGIEVPARAVGSESETSRRNAAS